MDEMDEIVAEFLVESRENLDRLDAEFVELEQNPTSSDLLGSIFRTIHTIKGTAAFLDFAELERVAHNGENLLSLLRDGTMTLDSHLTTILLEMVDAIRSTLDVIDELRTDRSQDFSDLSARLAAIVESGDSGAGAVVAAATAAVADRTEDSIEEVAVEVTAAEVMAEDESVAPAIESSPPPADEEEVDDHVVVATAVEPVAVPAAPVEQMASVEPATPPAAAPAAAKTAAEDHDHEPTTAGKGKAAGDSTIRVDVGLLDRLMNLVSELVLARNQVRQFSVGADQAFQAAVQELDLVTSDLQQAVMETRMQPVGGLFGRLPRMVRDLATTCGKRVKLEMEGEETELDKTLLEAIRDPLTHIVRNSVDHGLESPEARVAAGKSEIGLVRLSARHEGGQVIIDISDDGGGLDLDRIAAKVVERGVMSAETVAAMSDREVANLIFLAGLSTAEAVTKVSGRGVGMDVVKRSIDEIGGTIEIQTELGVGTTLTLRIPLTLAIIPALSVACGGERYLIPQLNVLELHRVSAKAPVELIGGTPIYRLRGELLPIIHWRDVLGELAPDHDTDEAFDPAAPRDWDDAYIVVLTAHGLDFGLAVDRVENTEEIVVKPLRSHIKDVPAFAGSTVLGDGSVALILDPIGITLTSGLNVDGADDRIGDHGQLHGDDAAAETVLVCEIQGRRVGFPLDGVTRLENFDLGDVNYAGNSEVVQYRGSLMRLIRPEHLLGYRSMSFDQPSPDRLLVLVHEEGDEVSGLVVDRILEVHRAPYDGGQDGTPPIRRSVPIEGVVTDIVDAGSLVAAGSGSLVGAW
jgi:two-component system, chemotaxis family, sensor kinase CheA